MKNLKTTSGILSLVFLLLCAFPSLSHADATLSESSNTPEAKVFTSDQAELGPQIEFVHVLVTAQDEDITIHSIRFKHDDASMLNKTNYPSLYLYLSGHGGCGDEYNFDCENNYSIQNEISNGYVKFDFSTASSWEPKSITIPKGKFRDFILAGRWSKERSDYNEEINRFSVGKDDIDIRDASGNTINISTTSRIKGNSITISSGAQEVANDGSINIDSKSFYYPVGSMVKEYTTLDVTSRLGAHSYTYGDRQDILQANMQTLRVERSENGGTIGDVHNGDFYGRIFLVSDKAPSISSAKALFDYEVASFKTSEVIKEKTEGGIKYSAINVYGPAFNIICMERYKNFVIRTTGLLEMSRSGITEGHMTNFCNDILNPAMQKINGYSGVKPVPAGYFPDTNPDELEGKAAKYLKDENIISGKPDGSFDGTAPVNRAELAKFLLNGKKTDVGSLTNNGRFPDVEGSSWYEKYVMKAADLGIINGYPNGTFEPAKTVNTAEFLKMLCKTFGITENLSHSYSDVNSEWFAKYAGAAKKYDLFPGRTSGKLDPAKELSRNEVAVAIYQYLNSQ